MKTFKLFFTLILIFTQTPLLAQGKPLLRVGYVNYPPIFITHADGTVTGSGHNSIEKELSGQFQTKWMQIPSARVEFSLDNDFIDTVVTYIYLPKRAKFIDYGPISVANIAPGICSLNEIDPKISFKEILTGKRVARLTNVVLPPEMTKHSKAYKLFDLTDQLNNVDRLIKLLKNERADLVYFPSLKEFDTSKLHCRKFTTVWNTHYVFKKGNELGQKVTRIVEEYRTRNKVTKN